MAMVKTNEEYSTQKHKRNCCGRTNRSTRFSRV